MILTTICLFHDRIVRYPLRFKISCGSNAKTVRQQFVARGVQIMSAFFKTATNWYLVTGSPFEWQNKYIEWGLIEMYFLSAGNYTDDIDIVCSEPLWFIFRTPYLQLNRQIPTHHVEFKIWHNKWAIILALCCKHKFAYTK
jgi:hypothetical protein